MPLKRLKERWSFFPLFFGVTWGVCSFVQCFTSNNLWGMHKVNSTWEKILELGTQQVEEEIKVEKKELKRRIRITPKITN